MTSHTPKEQFKKVLSLLREANELLVEIEEESDNIEFCSHPFDIHVYRGFSDLVDSDEELDFLKVGGTAAKVTTKSFPEIKHYVNF